jgi:hypothetical protein
MLIHHAKEEDPVVGEELEEEGEDPVAEEEIAEAGVVEEEGEVEEEGRNIEKNEFSVVEHQAL